MSVQIVQSEDSLLLYRKRKEAEMVEEAVEAVKNYEVSTEFVTRLQTILKGLRAEAEKLNARVVDKGTNGCRLADCGLPHRGSRKSFNARKNSRGLRLFCGRHCGLRRLVGKRGYRRLAGNNYLVVAV